MVGIAFGWSFDIGLHYAVALLAMAFVLLLWGMHSSSPRSLFAVSAMAVMLFTGVLLENFQKEDLRAKWCVEELQYKARLLEVPDVRGTSVKVLANVSVSDTLLPKGVRTCGDVYLYFPVTVDSEQLCAGDSVYFTGVISPFANYGNPAEFDIEGYYYVKGITGSLFLRDGMWVRRACDEWHLGTAALEFRDRLITVYRELGFEGKELSLLSALTLGEKRDFPKELKESYSAAGAGHVLALSGLHLGFIYMILMFLLPLRGRKKIVLVAREAVIILLLWGFAFVAGLSPSVVRSAILFTLISIGRCIGNDNSSINSLSFAAIVMLLFSPHLLFDVSFQLSFAAVFSIMLIAPPLQSLLRVDERNRVTAYILNLLILSVAAQIGTLPFVWYYFGVFPLYFMLTNFLVIPFAFIIVLMALVVLLLFFVPFLQGGAAMLLGKVLYAMNYVVDGISSLPGASYELPPLGVFGAMLMTLFVIALLWSAFAGRWRATLVFAICGALLAGIYLYSRQSEPEVDCIIVYNNRKNPLVHAVSVNGANYLASSVPQSDAEYDYVATPYIKREGLSVPVWAASGYSDSLFVNNEGLLRFSGVTVKLVDSDNWNENIYSCPVDAVLLCRGFKGDVKELLDVYPTHCLLLDASLYSHSRRRIQRECVALDVEPVDLSSTGAVKIVPGKDSFELLFMRGK